MNTTTEDLLTTQESTATRPLLTKDASPMGAGWKHYQPPASDRPSGAARRRAEHERLKNGITPVEEKAGIPRGRQGVRRG